MFMNGTDRRWDTDHRLLIRVGKLLARNPQGLTYPAIWQDFQAHRSPWTAGQLDDALRVLIVGEVIRQKWDGDRLTYHLHERMLTDGNPISGTGSEQVEA